MLLPRMRSENRDGLENAWCRGYVIDRTTVEKRQQEGKCEMGIKVCLLDSI